MIIIRKMENFDRQTDGRTKKYVFSLLDRWAKSGTDGHT